MSREDIFTVEVKGADGTWSPGPPFDGLDVLTGYVGGQFTGSYERALEHAKKLARTRVPNSTRVCQYGRIHIKLV